MTTYTIHPGNIAACCTVEMGPIDLIYMAEGKPPATLTRLEENQFKAFLALPPQVQAAVNRHYAAVFALPLEQRGEYMKNAKSIKVTV